jgi:hypothetical protein
VIDRLGPAPHGLERPGQRLQHLAGRRHRRAQPSHLPRIVRTEYAILTTFAHKPKDNELGNFISSQEDSLFFSRSLGVNKDLRDSTRATGFLAVDTAEGSQPTWGLRNKYMVLARRPPNHQAPWYRGARPVHKNSQSYHRDGLSAPVRGQGGRRRCRNRSQAFSRQDLRTDYVTS